MFTTEMSLILLAAIAGVCMADGVVKSDGDIALPDGKRGQVFLKGSVGCGLQQDEVVSQDGTSTIILKDFKLGKSVLLSSKSPDVCFVRDIPREEISEHAAKCRGGVVLVNENEEEGRERTYVEGEQLSNATLSSALKSACKGRKLQAMVPAVKENGENRLGKRCIRTTSNTCRNVHCCCVRKCVKYGWFFGANKCKRYEDKCKLVERCTARITNNC